MSKRPTPELPLPGHWVLQGHKHSITIVERKSNGKTRTLKVVGFRGKVIRVISSAFDAHFIDASGDKSLGQTKMKREGEFRGGHVDYHGWVRWGPGYWETCKSPTQVRPKKRETKNMDLFNEG